MVRANTLEPVIENSRSARKPPKTQKERRLGSVRVALVSDMLARGGV